MASLGPKSDGAPPMAETIFKNRYLLGTACSKFQDHDAQDAITAYYGERPTKETNILSPLWSLQFYVTYGATAESEPELPLRLLSAARKEMREPVYLRLDIYFLPGADAEACAEHYRAERRSRLPAKPPLWFVEHCRDAGGEFQVLFMVPSSDWFVLGISRVSFDSDDPDEPDYFAVERDIPVESQGTTVDGHRRPLGNIITDMTFQTDDFDLTRELYEKALKGEEEAWSLTELDVSLPDT